MLRFFAPALVSLALVACGSSSSDSTTTSSSGTGGNGGSGGGGGTNATGDTFVRMNLVGFAPDEPKRALLLSAKAPTDESFSVDGKPSGKLTPTGSWNAAFSRVAEMKIDVDAVTADATIASNGATEHFVVADRSALYEPLLKNAKFFYTAQRDGEGVDPAVLHRKASHLTDRAAMIYDPPTYADGVLKSELVPVSNATIDVEGGWFDAGDYLKFVQTTSYTTSVLLVAARDYPSSTKASGIASEVTVGLDWLRKMYDDANATLYYQVGIGDGNRTIRGDHDYWRLPEKDDARGAKKGDADYFVEYRPVFRAAPPGEKISPNLAGRYAAAFALAAQTDGDASAARDALTVAAHVFELAETSPHGRLVTASPFDYYPETEWRDDLELGAAEIYLAMKAHPEVTGLPHAASDYLALAAHWAHEYIHVASGSDSLNLYDVSALAHRELWKAIDAAGGSNGLEVSKADLASDLRAQLDDGVEQAKKDPFGFGIGYGDGDDATPHAFGFAMTARYYRELTKKLDFEAFRIHQRDWIFGANAWGSSFVIGAGRVSPRCPQHQIANLLGEELRGGVVDGPSAISDFDGLGIQTGMKPCEVGKGALGYQRFTGKGARFEDNVVAYPSVEPTLDYTALSVLFFASEMN